MLRSIAELAAYGTFAVLLVAASLAPEAARATSSAAVPNSSADRGRLLFTTKGCVGCHVHSAIPGSRMNVGPDLTALSGRAGTRVVGLDARGYVRESLRDPQSFRAPGYDGQMPDLRLTDEEIESLSAFLLAPPR